MRAAEWEDVHSEDRVVVLSDVWLDRPTTLDQLRLLLTGTLSLMLHLQLGFCCSVCFIANPSRRTMKLERI